MRLIDGPERGSVKPRECPRILYGTYDTYFCTVTVRCNLFLGGFSTAMHKQHLRPQSKRPIDNRFIRKRRRKVLMYVLQVNV